MDGHTVSIEYRWADGRADRFDEIAEERYDRLPELARELQALRPAVVVMTGTLLGLRGLEPTTPAVFANIAADLVKLGYIQGYSRPGGRLTGNVLTALGGEDTIAEKRVTLFKQLVPSLSRLGMLGQSESPLFREEVAAAERAASHSNFDLTTYPLSSIDDLENAMASALRDQINGIWVSGDPRLFASMARVVASVGSVGKPSVAPYVEWARAGVLMTYSADLIDGWQRAGIYAGKFFKEQTPETCLSSNRPSSPWL